eukprot:Rmarinus@m.24614
MSRQAVAATSVAAEYLTKSVIPTMHFQKSLLRLPIPKLEETCHKFVRAVTPLLEEPDLIEAKRQVEDFKTGRGAELQSKLVAWDKTRKHTSYISDVWFDKYFADRSPLMINSNFQLTLKPNPVPELNEQLARAASLVKTALKFKRNLDEDVLEPEIFHLKPQTTEKPGFKKYLSYVPEAIASYGAYPFQCFPLDMSQYKSLFGTTRVPKEDKDVLSRNPTSKHVVVLHNGRYFAVDAYTPEGRQLSHSELLAAFRGIVAHEKNRSLPPEDEWVGALTSEERNKWAHAHSVLSANQTNAETIRILNSALFMVCLDKQAPDVVLDSDDVSAKLAATQQEKEAMATEAAALNKHMICGELSNRWYDKSFQVIVTHTGATGINAEHSWGDGVAVLRLAVDMYKDTHTTEWRPDASTAPSQAFKALEWDLNDEMKSHIKTAVSRATNEINSLDVCVFLSDRIRRNKLKQLKLTPDGVVQTAMQLAYYKMHKKTVSTYESASTAAFKHGRTECIRTATPESQQFVQAFVDSGVSWDEKVKKLQKAVNTHGQLVKEAAMGKGIDRHLFILEHLAKEEGGEGAVPEVFRGKGYKTMKHDILSTSTLVSPYLVGGGFGPVVRDGYGLGYSVRDDLVGFVATSYGLNTWDFIGHLNESIDSIADMVESGNMGKKE